MASTGFTLVGTGETVNTGGTAWTNPGNITADDGSAATCNVGSSVGGATGDTLRGSNCGFAIPTDATIDGIEVRAQLSYTAGNGVPTVLSINVGKDDSTPGTAKTPGTVLTTSFVDYDYGSSSDLWGLTWTPAEINSTEFQAFFNCNNTGIAAGVSCDAMWINVHYTEVTEIDADADTSGASSIEAAGNALADANSDSSGSALVEAAGNSIADADADSTGSALSEAEGASTDFQDGAGLTDGVSAPEAAGAALIDADADSSGTALVEATGDAIVDADGLTTGAADPEAVGAFVLTLNADALSDGISVIEAVGASMAESEALSDGSANFDADGAGGVEIRQGPLGGSGVRGEASAWHKPDKTRVRHRKPRQIEIIKVGKWPEEARQKPERLERIDYGKIIDQRDPEDVAVAAEEEALIAILALAA